MLRALPGCVALATIVTACSVGLEDNLDDYLRARGALKSSSTTPDAGGAAGQQPFAGSNLACPPRLDPDAGGVENFPWQPPAPLHQGRCTDDQAQTVSDCTVNDPQSQTPRCHDFVAAPMNQDCLACAITPATSPVSGPLIKDYDIRPNVEGCVAALSGDNSVNGCGPKMLALSICESLVCQQCTADTDYFACADAADKSFCADRMTAAACAQQYLPKCVSNRSMAEDALTLVRTFCGKP